MRPKRPATPHWAAAVGMAPPLCVEDVLELVVVPVVVVPEDLDVVAVFCVVELRAPEVIAPEVAAPEVVVVVVVLFEPGVVEGVWPTQDELLPFPTVTGELYWRLPCESRIRRVK